MRWPTLGVSRQVAMTSAQYPIVLFFVAWLATDAVGGRPYRTQSRISCANIESHLIRGLCDSGHNGACLAQRFCPCLI